MLNDDNITIVLTYDNPETYHGPVVEGWPPSKNRSVQLYIKGKCTKLIIFDIVKSINK